MKWLMSLLTRGVEKDPEVIAQKSARLERRRSNLPDWRADAEVAWTLFRSGRVEDAIADVLSELARGPDLIAAEFPQCTKQQKAAMLCARRSQIFGQLAGFASWRNDKARETAYRGIAHAWSIANVARDDDGGVDLRSMRSAGRWTEVLGDESIAAVALRHRRAVSDADVDALSAAIWDALSLPAEERIKA